MKKLLGSLPSILGSTMLALLLAGLVPAAAISAAEKCASQNGDINADGKVDLTDAVTILGNLFLGNPTELLPLCTAPAGPASLPATGQADCSLFDQTLGIWVRFPCAEVI